MTTKQAQLHKKNQALGIDMSLYALNMLVWVEQLDALQDGESFLKGKIIQLDEPNFMVEVLLTSDKKEKVLANRIMERVDFGETLKDGFDDMVDMEILNDAELMENVRKRFMKDKIFTYVGPTLLVVNPFKKLPELANEDLRLQYIKHIVPAKGNPLAYKELSPHVYALAAEAYRSLFENGKNQSIVISGESGAGKTENAKFCMSLLISIGSFELFKHDPDVLLKDNIKRQSILTATIQLTQKKDISIEVKILNCNPVLEAFGNSKTKKNNNSSRFGKYVRMKVDKTIRKIKGAEIVNYLLEKSRIIQQGLMERNFHIFYHMIEGSSHEELTHLKLVKNGKRYEYEWFEFLKKSGNFVSPGIDDVAQFVEIRESFVSLDMSDYETNIFQVVSSVLLLGNVIFDGSTFGNDTACTVKNIELLNDIAELIGVNLEQLQQALVMKNRKVQNQVINSPLPEIECIVSKDSLAKELYERLFNWLVFKLNITIKPANQMDQMYVGLLDIYGFEVFDVNTFEQLMINYTNEKLHQLYIFYVFKEEERTFINEGLKEWCSQIKFNDNTALIELLEKAPLGIFCLLDESSSMASQNDDNLLQNIRKQHKTNPLHVQPKQPMNPTFIIIHTAKEVEYNVTGFRAKNKDETSSMLLDVMSLSTDKLVSQMFSKSDQTVKADKFLGTKIRKEMNELMKELNSCDVHFIRCLKPNETKQSLTMHTVMTLNQIRYLGVLDSLKVRKDSYPIRRTFQVFFKQFGDISKEEPYPILLSKQVDFKIYTEKLVKQFFSKIEPESFLIGVTKVFMRQPGLTEVVRIYKENIKIKNDKAIKIQKMFKCFKSRQGVKKYMDMIKSLKHVIHQKLTIFRVKKLVHHIVRVQRYIKQKFLNRKRDKVLNIAKKVQSYLKRSIAVKKHNWIRQCVIKIQRFVKRLISQKDKRKQNMIKQALSLAINKAWLVILGKKATKIQKVIRGWRVRTKVIGKDKMLQIKEAGVQEKIRKNASLLTRWVRGWLVRVRVKRMQKAARFIQGHFKMVWLSELFQGMRKSIIIIQAFVRMFIRKRQMYNQKYTKFVAPWDKVLAYIKEQEQINLFGVTYHNQKTFKDSPQSTRNAIFQSNHSHSSSQSHQLGNFSPMSQRFSNIALSPTTQKWGNLSPSSQKLGSQSPTQKWVNNVDQSPIKTDDIKTTKLSNKFKLHELDFQQSLSQSINQTPKNNTIRSKEQISSWQYESQVGSVDSMLQKEQELQALNQRIQLFTIVIDQEILSDLTEIYTEPWTKTYKEMLSNMFTKQSAIQVFEVAQTHTIAVTVCGKAYSWGLNDVGQLGHGESQEKPQVVSLPPDFRIKQITTGNNHSLILGYDGTIYGFGQNNCGQLGLDNLTDQQFPQQIITGQEPISQVKAVGNSSFAVSESGALFTWPISNTCKPYLVCLNYKSPVIGVSCGNQFAIIQQANGCLQSFGENKEGELGLGDEKVRFDPCMIEKLAIAGDKIVQVECGFKHVIAKSNMGKVYTWGWGVKGQLGHGKKNNEVYLILQQLQNQPKQLIINQKVLQVTASHKSSIIMTESHKLLWCGTNQSINDQTSLVDIKLQQKSILENYVPVRIYPSWSHTMSIISVTFANVKNALTSEGPLKHKVINQLVQKWVEGGAYTVDPPMIPQIATYLREKHMKKIIVQGQKSEPKNLSKMTTDREYKKNIYEIKKGFQSERGQKYKNPNQSSKSEIGDTENLNKLKDIKKRLISLKSLPQTQWNENDVEFIRTIYKSNLSQLLNNLNF